MWPINSGCTPSRRWTATPPVAAPGSAEIQQRYGYQDFHRGSHVLPFLRWLYAQAWVGTERPSMLFDRATAYLVTRKILLPGVTTLTRLVARARERANDRLWQRLSAALTPDQQAWLDWLLIPTADGTIGLERLRTGPTRVTPRAMDATLTRVTTLRAVGLAQRSLAHIPRNRLHVLARFALTVRANTLLDLHPNRRRATLFAGMRQLEAVAQDEVLDLLDQLLADLFLKAKQASTDHRVRTLRDLDAAARQLRQVCLTLRDVTVADADVRAQVFARLDPTALDAAMATVETLTRPFAETYQAALNRRRRRIRAFLPGLLHTITFHPTSAGRGLVAVLAYLQQAEQTPALWTTQPAPTRGLSVRWRRIALHRDGFADRWGYTWWALHALHRSLKKREIFVMPSVRYGNPQEGLLSDADWQQQRPQISRVLGHGLEVDAELATLVAALDEAYRTTAAALPENADVRIEAVDREDHLVLRQLDNLPTPASLVQLRQAIAERLPLIDLPELILEIMLRTGCADAFTHLSETHHAGADLTVSLSAVLLAEAWSHWPAPAMPRSRSIGCAGCSRISCAPTPSASPTPP